MRIIHKYVTGDYLITFALTLMIFTFVMCVGVVIKAVDLLSRGVSGYVILQVFFYNMPYILMFSIPMSTLTAVLLVFGRMSMDGEITAMRASGLSMWQIISPIIMASIILTFLCVYVNSSLAPESHFARRKALKTIVVDNPMNLLDEGRFVRDFPGMLIYVGKKDKQRVKDIVVYELGLNGVKRSIRAKSGRIRPKKEKDVVIIDLYDVRIDQPDEENPLDPTKSHYVAAEHHPFKLDFSDTLRKGELKKKISDMRFSELIHAIRDVESAFPQLPRKDLLMQRMALVVEANERLAISISCFAFTLLGIPLGIKSRRKETTADIAISLACVFVFYFFIIIAQSLVDHPEIRPDLIVWIPVIAAELAGFLLIFKMN